jgi:hypothetical protein
MVCVRKSWKKRDPLNRLELGVLITGVTSWRNREKKRSGTFTAPL